MIGLEDNRAIHWIETVLSEVKNLEGNQGIKILEKCGRECLSSYGTAQKAKEIRGKIKDKNDFDLLLKTFKAEVYKNSLQFYWEDDIIYLEYHGCGCPLVKDGKITDPFLCNCTRGYAKEMFETLLNKPLEVELLETVLSGSEKCKLAIRTN